MTDDRIRTRFAPSPTGLLHVGNLRTALFSWMYARQHQGVFVLRIEDTDAARNVVTATQALLDDLAWFGLDFDEGPGIGGPYAPYAQSERLRAYTEGLQALEKAGLTYPCFCSREALELSRRTQLAQGRPPQYAGTCARLSEPMARARLAAGETACIRFRVSTGPAVVFVDGVRGEQRFEREHIGDFILVRSDGTPAFFYSNALDDAQMAITDVLRGEDHLSNTPRQLLIIEALGLAAPRYAHLPLVLGDDGSPLSKRHGAVAVAEYRQEGIVPLALWNQLARLGHHYSDESLLGIDALVAGLHLDAMGRSGARFDRSRLEHFQHLAIAALDRDAFGVWSGQAERFAGPDAAALHAALRENVARPADVNTWLEVIASDALPLSPEAKAVAEAAGAPFYGHALDLLELCVADFPQFTRELKQRTGYAGKALFGPLRAALTGQLEGPELKALLPLIGKARIEQRLKRCL